MRDDAGMKNAKVKAGSGHKKASTEIRVRGKRVPTFGGEFVVIRTDRFTGTGRTKVAEEARVLVKKAGKALARPGISDKTIFKHSRGKVFAYSVDPGNPEKIVRRSVTGQRTVGRFADGRFKSD
jgi:hypothetical protein